MSEQILSSSILLGDLIAKYPNGGPLVLNKLGIDYCCGGQRSLNSVVPSDEECLSIIKQVQEKEIQQQQEHDTQSQQECMIDWKASQLVQHIIRHHHDYLRENIPVLSQLLLKIYSVHMGKLIQQGRQQETNSATTIEDDVATSHPSILLMEKMYKTFQSLGTELLVHLAKEEKDVFPLIIQYEEQNSSQLQPLLKRKLSTLMEEHDEAGTLIKLMASMKKELPDYCKTVENTKKLLTELEENLYIHVHLENNILFKRILSSINN